MMILKRIKMVLANFVSSPLVALLTFSVIFTVVGTLVGILRGQQTLNSGLWSDFSSTHYTLIFGVSLLVFMTLFSLWKPLFKAFVSWKNNEVSSRAYDYKPAQWRHENVDNVDNAVLP